MNNNNLKHIYFIGIGGIGMSALARYFALKGYVVSGYDLTPSKLTNNLIAEGIGVHYDDNPERVPNNPELVIYTPAIPKDNAVLNFCLSNKYDMKKRAEVLGIISEKYITIACAGTHGKTTTSCMLMHLLNNSKLGCNAILGGISNNLKSNFLFNSNSKYLVTEADEYDRSFLKLNPTYAVVSSVQPDHLDIYDTAENLKSTYSEFTLKIKDKGFLFHKKDNQLRNLNNNISVVQYSADGVADAYSHNIRVENGRFHFDFSASNVEIKDLALQMPGRHNVENATAALAVASSLGVSPDELKQAISTFKGVERRFDITYINDDCVFIDDYAHHPQEIDACVRAAKELFPDKKITGIFQPHLYTRTRDFMDEFAISLSKLDKLVLMPIYPAREKPIEGVSSEALLQKVDLNEKYVFAANELLDWIKNTDNEVIITIGAGNIANVVKPIVEILKSK